MKIQELDVTQGSKSGAILLFDIYFSDFASMCSRHESALYAGDTILVYVKRHKKNFLIMVMVDCVVYQNGTTTENFR